MPETAKHSNYVLLSIAELLLMLWMAALILVTSFVTGSFFDVMPRLVFFYFIFHLCGSFAYLICLIALWNWRRAGWYGILALMPVLVIGETILELLQTNGACLKETSFHLILLSPFLASGILWELLHWGTPLPWDLLMRHGKSTAQQISD